MIFYVNFVKLPENHNVVDRHAIGLFDSNDWKGEGSYCGWYSTEYYLDTTLIAYGTQMIPSYEPTHVINPFDGDVTVVKQHYDKIGISSIYNEVEFEASFIEEALEIFKEQRWEQFFSFQD